MRETEVWRAYKGATFELFRKAFDSVLKDLCQRGIGNVVKRAEVISVEVEEKMWSEGILGDDTPQKLLESLVFGFAWFKLCVTKWKGAHKLVVYS